MAHLICPQGRGEWGRGSQVKGLWVWLRLLVKQRVGNESKTTTIAIENWKWNELLCNQRRVRSAPVFGLMPSRCLARTNYCLPCCTYTSLGWSVIGCARVIDFKRLNYAKLLLTTQLSYLHTLTHTGRQTECACEWASHCKYSDCNYLKYSGLICCQLTLLFIGTVARGVFAICNCLVIRDRSVSSAKSFCG